MAFDDFIEKAENLGGKKPIKVGDFIFLFLDFTHFSFQRMHFNVYVIN
jgi:hypothetical protein